MSIRDSPPTQHASNGTDRHLADYAYMGLANLVSSAYPVPGVEMTLIAQTGDPQSGPAGDKYTGLDRFGRLVDKRWIKTGTSNPIVDLVRAQYTYDRASNRLTHTNPVATAAGVNLDQSYSYDGLYQVASHQTGIGTGIPATEEQFTYDPTGNWNRYKTLAAGAVTEDTPRTNNSANQITQIAGTPELIAHNATGNTTRIPKPADPTKSFDLKWDAWNRLVKVADSETGDPVAVYTYDGLYRRISTDDGAGTDTRRYYYNQQWRCVEEFNGEDSAAKKLLKRYFWGAQNRWELIARQRDTDGNETLDEELFVLSDAIDPVAIVNANGSVQERYGYSAFGETTVLNPSFVERSIGSSHDWNLLFHAEFRDETGLYIYGFRYNTPKIGRWLSRDPIGEHGSMNSYIFVENNPTAFIDLIGERFIVPPFHWKPNVSDGAHGVTVNPQLTIELKCVLCDDNCYLIHVVRFDMVIEDVFGFEFKKKDVPYPPDEKKKIQQHEEKHVQRLREWHKKARELLGSGCVYKSIIRCELEKEKQEEIMLDWIQFRNDEANHIPREVWPDVGGVDELK